MDGKEKEGGKKDVEKHIKSPTSNSEAYFKRMGEFKPERRSS